MIRAFVDSSVVFAACFSGTGPSRRLFLEAIRGQVELVISPHVLEETDRNLAEKAPAALTAFHMLSQLMQVELAPKPSLGELEETAAYVHLKDAPIVAAALKAKVDCLVTWDRRHFIDDPRVAEQSGLMIITPGRLVALIEEQSGDRP